jgi:PAS domain S-box-containing protein
MATDQIQNLPGKTQTIFIAETKTERWLSWIRLWCAASLAVIFVPAWLLNRVSRPSFSILAVAIILLAGYSVFYLLLTENRRHVAKKFIYLLTFFDVAVITALLVSTLSPCRDDDQTAGIVFGAYFIAIVFTAFHYRFILSIFSGIASAVGYTAFIAAKLILCPATNPSLADFSIRVVLLLFASWLCAMVSRNNYKTVRKVLLSESRYDTLADRLPEMIFTMDGEGNFIWSNKGSLGLLGLPPEKLIGMNIRSFISKPELFKLEPRGVKNSFEIRDKNGKLKFADCTIQKVSRGSGAEVYDGLMTDETDRELAVAQREEMASRLYQHQKMESIGSLASGMAHDFNNTLQSIADISSMTLKECTEPETKKRMELILETTADARFLIAELLALGRKKLLDYRHINLKDFFSPLVTHYQAQFGDTYRLQLELPVEPLKINGDSDHLKRVFQNLFCNARDAMPGGGTITVSCSAKGRGGNEIAVIKVKDTGTGIAPELTEKIFDPFFTTKNPGKGTGLGLALVRRITALHQGRVFVEQTSPNGTTFRIELPMVSKGESEADTKSLMLNRISTMLLMLEDDPKIRNIMKFFLREFDYSIIEASTGAEALDVLKKNKDKCRVLITDWKLGSEEPHELINSLRAIRNDLIVVVVSGYPPISKNIENLKIYRWFTKPYDKNALDIAIQRALHGMPSQQA